MPTHAPLATAAPRIAVLTADESVMLAAQESLASDFHTTLLDSRDALLALRQEVALEAVLLDLDLPETSREVMLDLISQLHKRAQDLVILGLINSVSKAFRRSFLAAGVSRCFVAPIQFDEVQEFLRAALEERWRELETRKVREDALSRYSFGDRRQRVHAPDLRRDYTGR